MRQGINKYWTRDGQCIPAWMLSDCQLEAALAFAVFEMQVYGMAYDAERVNELETERRIRLSPENVVRFSK